jgi:hypothetical protein
MLEGFQSLEAQVGDCPDIQVIFNNLDLIANNARLTSNQVTCSMVQETIPASTQEQCIEIPQPSDSGVGDQRKLFLFRVSRDIELIVSDSANENLLPSIELDVNVKCNGVQIGSINDSAFGSLLCFVDQCPANSLIEICASYRLIGNQTGFPVRATGSVSVCGPIVCIGQSTSDISGYYNPGYNEGCCYDRKALLLAAQNATALCNSLSTNGDQSMECFTVNETSGDNIVLAGNLASDAEVLIAGSMRVCFRSTSSSVDGTLFIRPVIGCGNDELTCYDRSIRVPRAPQGSPFGPTLCTTLPIYACASCLTGDDIAAGLTTEATCETESISGTGTNLVDIVSIEQNYCVWLFNDVDTSSLNNGSGSNFARCLTLSFFQSLYAKINTLCEFASSRQPINLQDFNFQSQEFDTPPSGNYGNTISLVSGSPTTEVPVPIKKYHLIVNVQPCFTFFGGLNQEDVRQYTSTAQLTCGGVPVAGANASTSWQFTSSGFVIRCGRTMEISGCIDCPVDQDLAVEITTVRAGGQGVGNPSQIRYTVSSKGFCF